MTVYLVTTKKEMLPSNPIVMIDGTVPGFVARDCDLHFDHHRPGGDKVQLTEIPDSIRVPDNCVFVTTQTDADACAASAWLQLLKMDLDPAQAYEAKANLIAIAYDCDHLGLPLGVEWDAYREFAKNAVAALKISGDEVIHDLGLNANRSTWGEAQKTAYASECFKRGTESLIAAALGKSDWPGANGEAENYWARVEALRPYVNHCARMIGSHAVLDQRSLSKYCDPRLLVEWARGQENHSNITLTVRDRALKLTQVKYRYIDVDCESTGYRFEPIGYVAANELEQVLGEIEIPAYAYTLGSVPLHADGSPMFSDREVWQKLATSEREKRQKYGYPMPSTDWGGRNEVGGSSWNDACILTPEEVLAVAISQ